MDYQEGICRVDGVFGSQGLGAEVTRRDVLNVARRALLRFRERDGAVIHVRVAFDEHYHRMTSTSKSFAMIRENRLLLESDPSSHICEEVAPLPSEPVITKGCTNAFVGTNLNEKLLQTGTNHLVLGGVATNHVVETSARYAADSGYQVTVLEDACASFSKQLHDFSVENILSRYVSVVSSDEYFSTQP